MSAFHAAASQHEHYDMLFDIKFSKFKLVDFPRYFELQRSMALMRAAPRRHGAAVNKATGYRSKIDTAASFPFALRIA